MINLQRVKFCYEFWTYLKRHAFFESLRKPLQNPIFGYKNFNIFQIVFPNVLKWPGMY